MTDQRRGIRAPTTIWRYIAREFAVYFLVTFLFFLLAFIVNQVLYMAKQLLSRHAPPLDVLRLLLYAMPQFVARSFPFASLVGALMAVGRLNSDNEILVMEASGISLKRVFAPLLAAGLVLASFSFIVNDIFLPLGTIAFNKLYRKVLYSMPAMELKPYSVNSFQSVTIVTGDVEEGMIHDLMIMDSPEGKKQRTITAKSALLSENDDEKGIISFKLDDVFVISTDTSRKDRYEYSRSDGMTYNILLKDFVESITSVTAREMSSRDLRSAIEDKREALMTRIAEKEKRLGEERLSLLSSYASQSAAPGRGLQGAGAALKEPLASFERSSKDVPSDKSLMSYEREFQKKFSLPASALCFVLLAFPIGLMARKSGKMVGFAVGLIVSVLYWVMLYLTDFYGYLLKLPPFWLMWAPDMIIAAVAAGFAVGRKLS